MSALPPWLRSRLADDGSPATFVSFADDVARRLGLPTARPLNDRQRSYDTDRVWMLWHATRGGAKLTLERPNTEMRDALVLIVEWHQAPDPAVVAAMVRAYIRGGRRPRWPQRLFRRR
ncbi:hypothetical protein ACFC51_32590 [Streptomyces sp. NPDC055962]|uniref:hypothetical protein n=1 Tax=Streptomyces sp. NPDC055962 TaxID=3345667 RepID=UPI0035DEB83A